MLILAPLAIAASPTSPEANPPGTESAELCRSALARRLSLKIGSITVDSGTRDKGWKILRGSISGYRPPKPPAPGMAAPLHVVSEDYDYVCWLRGGSVRKTTVHRSKKP